MIIYVHSLMGLGGWAILNMWLSDSKKAQNIALLIQLMQVCMHHIIVTVCIWMCTIDEIYCAGINAVTSDPGVFEAGLVTIGFVCI